MGLGRAFLAELVELKRVGALDGASRVIEIGAQQLSDTLVQNDELLDTLYGLFGRPRTDLGPPVGEDNFTERAARSQLFWTSLGFGYAAIDYDGHLDSVALDLNRDAVPAALKGQFDLVVNAGTTEHVANQENAFQIIHNLASRRGVMMHEVPAGGMINHGFFNYHPRFFQTLAAFNLYEVLSLKMISSPAMPVPQSVRDDNVKFGASPDAIEASMMDYTIRAAFRRQTGKEFVTPLDIPSRLLPLKERQPWRGLRHAIASRLK